MELRACKPISERQQGAGIRQIDRRHGPIHDMPEVELFDVAERVGVCMFRFVANAMLRASGEGASPVCCIHVELQSNLDNEYRSCRLAGDCNMPSAPSASGLFASSSCLVHLHPQTSRHHARQSEVPHLDAHPAGSDFAALKRSELQVYVPSHVIHMCQRLRSRVRPSCTYQSPEAPQGVRCQHAVEQNRVECSTRSQAIYYCAA